MRKIYLFLLLLSFFGESFASNVNLEVRAAYFRPQDSRMREVYSSGWGEYQIQVSYDTCGCIIPWANFTFYEKEGKSSCLGNCTQIIDGSLTIGGKRYFCKGKQWKPYYGLGIGVDYVDFHDKSPYVDEHYTRWCPTIIAKSGVEIPFATCWFVDLFLDYSYTHFSGKKCRDGIRKRSLTTGGLHLGGGIGARF